MKVHSKTKYLRTALAAVLDCYATGRRRRALLIHDFAE